MSKRDLTFWIWALLGLAAVACQMAAIGSAGWFPGLLTVLRRSIQSRVGRVLGALVWMWLGWHLFAR